MEYTLEYGKNRIEIHKDAIKAGERILIFDDLLATGGTVLATAQLVEQLGGAVIACAFLIDLTFLKGAKKLKPRPVFSLIQY
jgi:adenine phosphoribosyltransferase